MGERYGRRLVASAGRIKNNSWRLQNAQICFDRRRPSRTCGAHRQPGSRRFRGCCGSRRFGWRRDRRDGRLLHRRPGGRRGRRRARRQRRRGRFGFEGDLQPGYKVVPGKVRLYEIPSEPHYSYIYVNDQPVLVDNRTDTVVWVGND